MRDNTKVILDLCKRFNITKLTAEDIDFLKGYDKSALEWILGCLTNDNGHLASAVGAYHSDWSGIQGGL